MALAAAVMVSLGLVGRAEAQWHWEPRTGWQTEPATAPIAEAAPPAFITRYRETPPEAPVGTAAGDYRLAYLVYEADQFDRAARLFAQVAERYGNEAPLIAARALFLRGECFFQAKSYERAFKAFDEMLTRYPGGPNYRLALAREFEVARLFLRGRRERVWGVPLKSGAGLALRILRRIREQDPRGALADDALAAGGDFHFRRGDFEDAILEYEALTRDYPQSPYAPQALFRVGCSRLFLHGGPEYDGGLLRQARADFERFLRLYPDAVEAGQAEAYLKEAEDRLGQMYLETGRFYADRHQPVSALVYFRRVVAEAPQSPAAAEAERLIRQTTGRAAEPGGAHPPPGGRPPMDAGGPGE